MQVAWMSYKVFGSTAPSQSYLDVESLGHTTSHDATFINALCLILNDIFQKVLLHTHRLNNPFLPITR